MPGLGFNFRERAGTRIIPEGEEEEGGGQATTFSAWYETATADTPSATEIAKTFDSEGVSQGTLGTPTYGYCARGEVHVSEDAALLIDDNCWFATRLSSGSEDWTIDDAPSGYDELATGQLLSDGSALLVWWDFVSSGSNKTIVIETVAANGTRTQQAEYTSSDITGLTAVGTTYYMKPGSSALSEDGGILHLLLAAVGTVGANAPGRIVGINTSTWAVAYEFVTDNIRVWRTGAANSLIRRIPGSEDVVISGSSATDATAKVGRYNYSAAATAPTEAWVTEVDDNSDVVGLAVDGDRAYVSIDVGFGHSDPKNLFAVALSDGSEVWSDDNLGGEVPRQDSLAAAGGKVLMGVVGDSTTFTTEGNGFVLLDGATGDRETIGVFPLETTSVGPVGAGDFAVSAELLTTTDGFPLGTTDGVNLETTEA